MIRRPPAARARSGFSLLEVTMAVVLVALTMAAALAFSTGILGLSQHVTATATGQSQARFAVDAMIRDLHAADRVLSTSGGYASGSGTLILEAPAYTSAGAVLSGKYDDIVYHLVGASAPYTLNRYVTAAAGSARASSADRVLVKNVQSLSLLYLVDQAITSGDGTTTRFALGAAVSGSGSGLVETVSLNGAAVPVTVGAPGAGQAQFLAPIVSPLLPQGSLQLGTAPAATDTVGLQYTVDPSVSASAAQVTRVIIDLRDGASDPSLGASSAQNFETASAAALGNH